MKEVMSQKKRNKQQPRQRATKRKSGLSESDTHILIPHRAMWENRVEKKVQGISTATTPTTTTTTTSTSTTLAAFDTYIVTLDRKKHSLLRKLLLLLLQLWLGWISCSWSALGTRPVWYALNILISLLLLLLRLRGGNHGVRNGQFLRSI